MCDIDRHLIPHAIPRAVFLHCSTHGLIVCLVSGQYFSINTLTDISPSFPCRFWNLFESHVQYSIPSYSAFRSWLHRVSVSRNLDNPLCSSTSTIRAVAGESPDYSDTIFDALEWSYNQCSKKKNR